MQHRVRRTTVTSICTRRISGPWIPERPAPSAIFYLGAASLTALYSSAIFSPAVWINNSIFETKQKTTLFANHSPLVQASPSPLIPGPDPRTRYSLAKAVSTKYKQSVQRAQAQQGQGRFQFTPLNQRLGSNRTSPAQPTQETKSISSAWTERQKETDLTYCTLT